MSPAPDGSCRDSGERGNRWAGRRVRNTFRGLPGAIWEYTYQDKQSGEAIHAIDQSYIADDGTEYATCTTERDRYWPDGHPTGSHASSPSRKQQTSCPGCGVVKLSARCIPSRRATAIDRSLRASIVATTRSTPAARTRSRVRRAAAVA